jgi:hypothetical protein
MPLTSRIARALVAACFVVVTWLSAVPSPAAALEPPRPLPDYRPAFVTETDERPWIDCLWASGAMLLDKWTSGEVTRTHQELRRLTQDRRGGSTLEDLREAYGHLGIDLQFSPDGGERVTWSGLLRRLSNGAGAVLLGDDSKLPRWYGRWDYSFWKLEKDEEADKDNHAVYIERYDRKHGRVWMMDPLGHGDWKGEWISVRALRRFAWTTHGGFLSVAITPTAKAAPYADVAIADPQLSMTPMTLDAAWGITAPRKWAFPGATAGATFEPADDPLLVAARSVQVTMAAPATEKARAPEEEPAVNEEGPASEEAPAAEQAPATPVAAVAGKSLRMTAALPTEAGAYQATLTLTDLRFGDVVARAESVAVFVPGPRRATLWLHVRDQAIEAGQEVAVSVLVANTGRKSWAEHVRSAETSDGPIPVRATRVVARWIRLDAPVDDTPPALVVLQAVPLAPGKATTVKAELLAPESPGVWALVVDVVDDVDGSFAALGSAPAVKVFGVVVPRGIAGVR